MNLLVQSIHRLKTYVPRTITLGGHPVSLPAGHLLDWYRLRHRRYDEPIADVCRIIAEKYSEASFIDIGANVGDTAALMAVSARVSVLCIEGNRRFIPFLKKNLPKALNDFEIEESYVGADDADVAALITTKAGTASIQIDCQQEAKKYSVRLRSLEKVLLDHPKFIHSKLLKVDTDGLDAKIIIGAAAVLVRMRPVIYVEYSPVGSSEVEKECRAMVECLRDIGYEYFHVFDNFGNHMLRLRGAETGHLLALNAYARSSRKDLKPAVFYYDICAMTVDDADLSNALLRGYIGEEASQGAAFAGA